jgi:nucleotidyltransferase substrate binding protein (TIGR01987 family)
MEDKYINRYNTFIKVLSRLKLSKTANPYSDFVLEGTIQNFNLTFDVSWKVMKDILVKRMGVVDFAIGSPREVLRASFTNGLIESDLWMQMLNLRNQLAHDYDGSLAIESFDKIITIYYDCFEKFKNDAKKYMEEKA